MRTRAKFTAGVFAFAMGMLTASAIPAFAAGPNDFFGNTIPANNGDPSFGSPAQNKAAEAASGNLPVEYTDDEKRMQKKYRASIVHAKSLIVKGDRMMKDGTGKDDKAVKKGKIIKEIGEKSLADLEANNPIPHENLKPKEDKFDEKKKADKE